MKNTIKAFANYGVLAKEKKVVYTAELPHIHAATSEEITIEIPETFEIGENMMGQTIITTPDGEDFRLNDILSQRNGNPAFKWFDKDQNAHYKELKQI